MTYTDEEWESVMTEPPPDGEDLPAEEPDVIDRELARAMLIRPCQCAPPAGDDPGSA
jgi:hypothetical protein